MRLGAREFFTMFSSIWTRISNNIYIGHIENNNIILGDKLKANKLLKTDWRL